MYSKDARSVNLYLVENGGLVEQDVFIAGPFHAMSPKVENSTLEGLRICLKEETTSEIKNRLVESQRELLKLLKPKTGDYNNEEDQTLL